MGQAQGLDRSGAGPAQRQGALFQRRTGGHDIIEQ